MQAGIPDIKEQISFFLVNVLTNKKTLTFKQKSGIIFLKEGYFKNITTESTMKYELLRNLYYKDTALYEAEIVKRLNSDCAYKLNIIINGNHAFFLRTPDLYETAVKIIETDSELYELCSHLPGAAINQYIGKSLIGEITGTHDIEHIHSSRSEINEILVTGKAAKNNRFVDIVKRYELLGKEKYSLKSCSDIRKIYDDLLSDEIRKEDELKLPDGELFRRSGVNVHTSTDKVIHKGVQPESEIINYMNKSLEFLNRDDVNFLFRIAVFHYLFGYIHPFYDGNGRISRFISSALLYENMHTDILAFRLSYTLKQNINEYYKAFKVCNDPRNKGDLTPFVYMFFNMIVRAMDNLKESLVEKNEKLDYYRERLPLMPHFSDKHMPDVYFILLQACLFSEGGISKEELGNGLALSRGAIDNCFKKIPTDLLTVKLARRTKLYSLDLEHFDDIIHDGV